jgi:hypothetical protein
MSFDVDGKCRAIDLPKATVKPQINGTAIRDYSVMPDFVIE